MSKLLFTSESVTEGHPDKVCDCVSDAVLDAILSQDKNARVACETFCTTGVVTVMGEITQPLNWIFRKLFVIPFAVSAMIALKPVLTVIPVL